jgi:ech hydrogenase subunit D
MDGPILSVQPNQVVGESARIKAEGYRFVTLSYVERGADQVEILYHFDRDFQMTHLRLTIDRKTLIPSITPVFLAAFLVENEIQDLYGLRVQGLPIDYHRTFYLDAEVREAPLCTYTVAQKKEADHPAGE